MKKYLLPLITLLALLCQPALARAGTCNASYADSLPQTSGSIGALPPDSPGQTPLGYITHIEATGGPAISWTYTPIVGSPVTSTINFGTSSGISCTSNQAGGWTGAKVYGLYWQNYPGVMTQLVINGSTAPSNLLTCTGMVGTGSSGSNYFSSNDGLQMIWAGPGTEHLNWAGYNTVTGSIHQNNFDMAGSCGIGAATSPSFAPPTASSDTHQILHLYAYGSGGITNVEFFVDGVSKGSDSSAPFDFQVVGVAPGPHTLSAKATFSIGTATTPAYTVMFAPYKAAVGSNVACAIVENGNLKCWGRNNYGQLGTNSAAASSATPTYVVGNTVVPSPGSRLAWVQDVSVGLEGVCAINNTGVACWGKNTNGILGVSPGTLAQSNVPVQVIPQGSGVTNIQVGQAHACARYSTGHTYCWGNGQFGQLANGSNTATNITPTLVAIGVAKVVLARDTTYFLIGSDAWASGRDNYGQLGNGSPYTDVNLATRFITGGVTDLWAGKYHACAKISGTLKCWGSNNTGELANGGGGTGITAPSPTLASAFSGLSVIDIIGGDGTTCALTLTQGLKCVGYNAYGQLGLGFTSSFELVAQAPSIYNSSVWSVSAGWTNICAFNSGHYKCAGDNTYGQIGDPAAGNPEISPYTVLGL